MASPAANVYLTLTLDYADAAALGKVFGEATGGAALVFDAEGYASLPNAGAPGFLHFDVASKRLSALGGMYANLDSLKAMRKAIADGKVEPRAELALEREIDAHGDGLVIWADVEAMRPILAAAVTGFAGRRPRAAGIARRDQRRRLGRLSAAGAAQAVSESLRAHAHAGQRRLVQR